MVIAKAQTFQIMVNVKYHTLKMHHLRLSINPRSSGIMV